MTQQTTGLTPDPRPQFLAAAAQAAALIGTVRPDELDRSTPCAEFDVRALARHMIAVLQRITHVATGGNAFDVPSMAQVADGDLADTAAADAARLQATWSDDDVLDRMLTLPFATLPGRGAALAYTQELTTHAWDLATAVGRADTLDPAPAEAVVAAARRFVPAEARGGEVPFGPVVDVPPDAGPYERLVGWLGRDPQWHA